MSPIPGNLSAQLENKLSDQNVLLSSRLDVARTVFCSSEIPILEKEVYILSWILKTLSCSSEMDEKEIILSCLLKCFQSKRIHNFRNHMRQSVIEDLVSALKYDENYPGNLKLLMRQCSVEIFRISFFQRWFMCDVENLCKTAGNYFKYVTDLDSSKDMFYIIGQLVNIQKMSLLKGEVRVRFIKDVLVPMCKAISSLPLEARKTYIDKTLYCWREVLMFDSRFVESYILLLKQIDENASVNSDSNSNNDITLFIRKIEHLPTKQDVDVVELCYTLFLRSVVLKYPDEYEKIFQVFTTLCPPLGITVNSIISIETAPVENWDIKDSFSIITKLIDVLDESKIPLTCQLEEVSLQNWFTSFVIGLSNINYNNYSVRLLKMIKRVYEFNPLVIEPSCKIITAIMLQIKGPKLIPTYITFIESIIKGSSKVQRLQKFVAFFLTNMKEQLLQCCKDELSLTDVLPPELILLFSSAFRCTPAIQVLTMVRSFTFHLERDCINYLEDDTDRSVIINYGVICELLSQLIWSANLIDHSVPETVQKKYKTLLEDLQVLLATMGNILENFHVDPLLAPYLKLCRAFGDIKIKFREYENIEIVKPLDIDLEPTNISYIHNYLHPDSWKRIAGFMEEHVDCQAANEFYELLIQKVVAVFQVEEGAEGPGTQAARYLLQHADTGWLWDKILTLAPLFQSTELAKLVAKLVRHLGSDQSKWTPLLKQQALTENSILVLAMAFSLLKRASKKLDCGDEDDGDIPLSRQVLDLVTTHDFLEYELSQIITDDEELLAVVEGCISEMAAILNENLSILRSPSQKIPHISMLEIPARLPLHHLSAVSQSCVLFSTTAILYDLPPSSEADMLLFNLLLKIMDGPQKNCGTLLNELNPGYFLKFVATRGLGYRGQRKLMKRICILSLRSKKSAKLMFSEVNEPTASDVWVTALVIDCLAQLRKKYIGSEKVRKPLERRKCLDHLMSAVLPILCSNPATPAHLYTFTVIFCHTLRYLSTHQEQFSKLTHLLKEYIDFSLSDYLEGERLVECLVEHRSELGDHFPSTLVMSTFEKMKLQVIPPTETTSHLLFGCADITEFKSILNQMLNDTIEGELDVDSVECRRLFLLRSHLMSALLGNEKSREREDALSKMTQRFVNLSESWASGSAVHLVLPVMILIITATKNTGVILRGPVIDSFLELVGLVPLPMDNPELALDNLGTLLNAMLAMYCYRTSLLIDRLPAFLQRYRRCLVSLAPLVPPSSDYIFIKKAVPVADKIERLATTMVKRQKDFARLAPYLIADLMSIFQQYNISSDVKFAYTNVVNAFLSISDKHAISYLKGILPTAQQELFNGFYENYNKFHRFVGKI